MADPKLTQILGRIAADRFIGRDQEFERLIDHIRGDDTTNGLAILAEPFSGSGELLRQVYDQIFREGGETIPFFFDLRHFRGDMGSAAAAFPRALAIQIVAFGRRDPSVLNIPRDLSGLAAIASPRDYEAVIGLSAIEDCPDLDIRRCFSAPLIAAEHGLRIAVLIAGVEDLLGNVGNISPIDIFCANYRSPRVRLIVSGHRRAVYGRTPFPEIGLSSPADAAATEIASAMASARGIETADHICDLIAEILGGSPALTAAFFRGVQQGTRLTSYGRFAREYAGSVCGGDLSLLIDGVLRGAVPDIELRSRVISILCAHLDVSDGFVPMSFWNRHLGTSPETAAQIVDALNCIEVIDLNYAGTRLRRDKLFLADHFSAVRKLGRPASQRALVVSELISDIGSRSPEQLERAYRRRNALGLKELLETFASQTVSTALLDFRRFRSEFRGADPASIDKALKDDPQKLTLPTVSFAANTAHFYPQFADLCDIERSAIAIGTADGGNERSVWIAAEVASKLEASAETAEFWCDRLEMAAANSGFEHFTIWLIATEGFSEDALDVLDRRGAYGSSRQQAELLRSNLTAPTERPERRPANEYELSIPIGDETEVAAVHAFEEAARRHNVAQKTVNQIKTALVEACINACEHSNSPDGKIGLRFAFLPDRVELEVTNRGIRLTQENADAAAAESRRGWGLKLMKGLMDDVRIESGEGRTTVRLSKYITAV